ncbi:AraC family ligand binding domain-containing protein [Aquaticitalea lipolytica]|uniref:AraC family ligand binding domain-containing protein n=1 Tax=Aquaticitalea lipolytica TaxID=1247562 RepID=UPI0024BB4EE4|nr:AraC family ligand binding domain-containing protein [Aquaticitalea lipolytica]
MFTYIYAVPRTIIENIVIQKYKDETFFTFCKYTTIRFFEIVYIEEGKGTIKINGKTVPYKDNSIFVFIPDDIYIIQAETPTTVTAIKFLKSFLEIPRPIMQLFLLMIGFEKSKKF